MMNKTLLSFSFALLFTVSAWSQYGYNCVGMGAVDYIEVPDDPGGSLDVPGAFTFEAWILNASGTSNQKIGGKLAADFQNGFIYGIEDQQVNMEVFDNTGTNTSLKAGFISAVGWTHVAGAYEVGGMLEIFVNGTKVGETPASSNATEFNENPFRIGIAPWDVNALGFAGYIDEVRYWQTNLDESTIKAWMHRDVTSDHPEYDNLTLYHKYNEAEGPIVLDDSGNENHGNFSATMGHSLEPMFQPFVGDFELLENNVQGVWNAKASGSSDIMAIHAQFVDTLDFSTSAVFGHSNGDYGFGNELSSGHYPMNRTWQTILQGDFLVDVVFDLSGLNTTDVSDVVLLASNFEVFTSGTFITGDYDSNAQTFTVSGEALEDEKFYSLGIEFIGTPTFESQLELLDFKVYPQPNNGDFQIDFSGSIDEVKLAISDLHGKLIWENGYSNGNKINLELSDVLLPGLYTLKMYNEAGYSSTQKLMVQY